LAGAVVNAAGAVEEPAVSKSPASPSAMTVFCMTRLLPRDDSISGFSPVAGVDANQRRAASGIALSPQGSVRVLVGLDWRGLDGVSIFGEGLGERTIQCGVKICVAAGIFSGTIFWFFLRPAKISSFFSEM
jgi:hypothetical protein